MMSYCRAGVKVGSSRGSGMLLLVWTVLGLVACARWRDKRALAFGKVSSSSVGAAHCSAADSVAPYQPEYPFYLSAVH